MSRFSLAFLLALSAFGQSAQPGPSFEVAEIRVNASGLEKSSGNLSNGRLTLRNLPLRFLLAEAWTMNPDDISGPSWLDDVRVDAVAKAASPQTPDADLRLMLQTLLKDRMKLASHIERRQKSVWALAVWKRRAKMTSSEMPAKPEDADCRRSGSGASNVRLTCKHETMAAFAHELPQYAGGYVTSTVVDQTSLNGAWDFTFEWTPMAQLESSGGLTLFAALQAQVGLQLERRKLPVPILVVDSMQRTPSEN
ncbi:MAG TPA: TIGR03435 family protein [Bryobacteraceae bacterium]|jgi:uncharacterized protein (TIGR03435 family)|nr:TIGR03435 family protein [Bryobacteraceae bacterium]